MTTASSRPSSKTLKYRPDFPDRFGFFEDGETLSVRFFPWHDTEHRHGALGLGRAGSGRYTDVWAPPGTADGSPSRHM
jgi:hypothetical protein